MFLIAKRFLLLCLLPFAFSGCGGGGGSSNSAIPKRYTLTNLSALSGNQGQGERINDVGDVLADESSPTMPNRAVLHSGTRFTILGPLPGDMWSYAVGLNDVGEAVGRSAGASGQRAFLYQNGQVMDLAALTGVSSFLPRAINNQHQIAGNYMSMTGHYRAAVWKQGQFTDLGDLPNQTDTVAFAINNLGQVVGASGPHGFLWQNGKMSDIGDVSPVSINDSAQVAGRSMSDPNRGVFWEKGHILDLGILPGDTRVEVGTINAAGQIVGSSEHGADEEPFVVHPFLWHKGKMIELNSLIPSESGPTLELAVDINNKGQITGRALDANSLVDVVLLSPNF